jgi:hypothetical protein
MMKLLPGHRDQLAEPPVAEPLEAQLRRWATAGLLSDRQATAILAAEEARVGRPATPAPRRPVAVELVGYLGGVLAVVGVVLLAARSWQDLATWSRLTLLALGAAALWAAGALLHEQADPALWRLRAVLWLLSSATVAFLAGLFAAEVLDWEVEAVTLLAGLATATHAAVLWRLQPRPLQQLACLAGVATAAGAAAAAAGGDELAVGLSVWAVGVLWVAGGWSGLLPPPVIALGVGSVVLLLGAQLTAGRLEGGGPLLGLGSALVLLLLGATGHRLVLAGVGIVGVFVFLPWTVGHYFADTVGVPVAILLSGVLLLGLTLVLLRRPVHPRT